MADRLDLDLESANETTHPEVPWQFQGTVKRPRSGSWHKSRKSPPLPQDSWNSPPNHSFQLLSHVQFFATIPASESFPTSQLFTWGGQSTGVSALASVLPKKSQGWSSEWTGWISWQSRDPQESSPKPQFKRINSSALSLLHSLTLTSIHYHRKKP